MIGRLLAIGIAVAGAAYFVLRKIPLDEREPIRIRNKKLTFELMTKEWKKVRDDGSAAQWRIDDPEGDSISTFYVRARRPSGQLPFYAETVTFKVNVQGVTKEYVLQRAQNSTGVWEPELISPPHLEQPANNKKVLRIKNEPDVWISEVWGDRQLHYSFDEDTGRIDIRAEPQP